MQGQALKAMESTYICAKSANGVPAYLSVDTTRSSFKLVCDLYLGQEVTGLLR